MYDSVVYEEAKLLLQASFPRFILMYVSSLARDFEFQLCSLVSPEFFARLKLYRLALKLHWSRRFSCKIVASANTRLSIRGRELNLWYSQVSLFLVSKIKDDESWVLTTLQLPYYCFFSR